MDGADGADRRAFGKLLRRHRVVAGLTQEQLAERAGVSVHSISNLERGVPHLPRADTLYLLATALRLSDEDRQRFEGAAGGRFATAAHEVTGATSPLGAQTRIPVALSPLIGRAALLEEVVARLCQPEVRLLTLVGSPGVGKTRLALAVAAHPNVVLGDGKVFVSLVGVVDAAQVMDAVARALAVNSSGAQSAMEGLLAYLRDREVLLLLDNFEHVVAAAPLVAELLAGCPGVKVLATSRASLRVRGEQQTLVPTLAVPARTDSVSLDDLARVPAVALFVERARAVGSPSTITRGNAPTIAAICQQLDGLPLAIELAASRLAVLSPHALHEQLVHRLLVLTGGPLDLSPHQRTLRSALAWSYDLLPPAAQALFRGIAAFAGGASLAAIEAVCCSAGMFGAGDADLLDALTLLVTNHLVVRQEGVGGESRFDMLATIREYGGELLSSAGDGSRIERAHAEYCLALAETADTALKGPEQPLWLERLEQEHADLRTALQWAVTWGASDVGLRLAASLWRFWEARGYVREGRLWLETLLGVADDAPEACSPAVRAKALSAAGILAWRLGDCANAGAYHTAALALDRQRADHQRIATDLNNLAAIAHGRGEYERAWELMEASLAIHRQRGDRRAVALLLKNLGAVAFDQGDFARCGSYLDESLLLRRELGDERGIASSLAACAAVALARGEAARAKALFREALAAYRRLGERRGMAIALYNLATLACAEGTLSRARRLCTLSNTVLREVGEEFHRATALKILGKIALAEEDYAQARCHFGEGLEVQRRLSDRLGMAEALVNLALVARAQGDDRHALAYLNESIELHQTVATKRNVAPLLECLGLVLHALGRRAQAHASFEMAARLRATIGLPLAPVEYAQLARALAADARWLAWCQRERERPLQLASPLTRMLARARGFVEGALSRVAV